MTGDHYQMVSGFFMFKIRIIVKNYYLSAK